ncbi:hypothetical protein [Flavobacterium zepuense]|nr:hypothetical protein [Flavobacterium zepuense]
MNYSTVKNIIATLIISSSLCFVSCSAGIRTTTNSPAAKSSKKMPPGQAKKLNGDKSAKKYAPGHN